MKTKQVEIYHFNPTCDYAVSNNTVSWQPNKLLTKMELDLEILPLFFTSSKDHLIVKRKPSEQYLRSLKPLNIENPMFILEENICNKTDLRSLQNSKLKPWGWSPSEHKFLSSLKESCSDNFKNSPVFNWLPEHRDLYSKKFASGILRQLIEDFPDENFIPQHFLPELCTTQAQFETLLKKWGELMVKAPWSSSGRGLQTIRKTPVHPKVWAKVLGIVKDQGYAIVEPYLNKVFDLAFQFEMINGKVNYLGISYFLTDYKGQYIGNNLNGFPDDLEKESIDFVNLLPELIIPSIKTVLEKSDLARYYEGNFGVDTLIYRNQQNELKVNPCLEINVRQNMGLLSLRLEKLIHSEKKGLYRTFYKPGTTFYQFAEEMNKKHPLFINEGKIESGFFPLTDATEDTLFGAYVLV